jgi:acetyltransferase-like isoleucine patch superfamily enzyme
MGNSHLAINEKELMDYYHYSGSYGRMKLRAKFLRTWILHSIAYSSPLPGIIIRMQRARGVKIGKNCHFSPYVQIDLLYPHLVRIEDEVAIGSNVMIFAHLNPTTNLYLKSHGYSREVKPVHIKSGAIIGPGSIITAGVTIGENSLVGVGSIVSQDVPDYCVVLGNPARIIKKIDH